MGTPLGMLDYALPAQRRSSGVGLVRKVVGIAVIGVSLALFVVAIRLVRMGCHEGISWLIDGNHGKGFGADYFVDGAWCIAIGVALIFGGKAILPQAFEPTARSLVG